MRKISKSSSSQRTKRSNSGSQQQSKQQQQQSLSATFSEKKFHELGKLEMKEVASSLWPRSDQAVQFDMDYANEDKIKDLVKRMLIDVRDSISALLPLHLTIDTEIVLFNLKADVWVVSSAGIPRGVVEVKMPGPERDPEAPLRSELNFGQLYDYMMVCKTFGLSHVFGLLTTYSHWRVCWLDDDVGNACALQTTADEPPKELLEFASKVARRSAATNVDVCETTPQPLDEPASTAHLPADIPQSPDEPGSDAPVVITTPLPDNGAKRTVCCGPIIGLLDPSLPSILSSAMFKMSQAVPSPAKNLVAPDRAYIVVTSTSYYWAYYDKDKLPVLRYNNMPDEKTTNFTLLQKLGGGGDGTAWLATNSTGKVCVIKFYHSITDNQADNEAKLWKMLWDKPARAQPLRNQQALIMPFVRVASDDDLSQPNVIAAVRQAVNTMAMAGLCHDDLSWRHVGLFDDVDGKLHALLLDLARVRSNVPHIEAETEMLTKLGLNSLHG
jgi:hypothetical protein